MPNGLRYGIALSGTRLRRRSATRSRPDSARREIDQPLHHEHHLGPAGAAIRPGRRGVGQRGAGAEMHGRHVVDARRRSATPFCSGLEPERVGAEIRQVRAAHRKKGAVGVERQLRGRPRDRAPGSRTGTPRCARRSISPVARRAAPPTPPARTRIEHAAGAEITADIVHHHAHCRPGTPSTAARSLLGRTAPPSPA